MHTTRSYSGGICTHEAFAPELKSGSFVYLDTLLRLPGIEPGAKPWKGSMLPLHHRRSYLESPQNSPSLCAQPKDAPRRPNESELPPRGLSRILQEVQRCCFASTTSSSTFVELAGYPNLRARAAPFKMSGVLPREDGVNRMTSALILRSQFHYKTRRLSTQTPRFRAPGTDGYPCTRSSRRSLALKPPMRGAWPRPRLRRRALRRSVAIRELKNFRHCVYAIRFSRCTESISAPSKRVS